MKKIRFLLLMIFGLVLTSCVSSKVTYEYELNKTSLTLEVGQSEKLSVLVTPEKEISVSYSSSDSSIASVSEDGTVLGVASGNVTITALVDDKTLTCDVTVNEKEIEYNYSLNMTSITLEEGATLKLEVNVTPAKDISPTFESSNNEVVTVDNAGNITACAAGNASIKVVVDGKELTCSVTVTKKEIVYEYSLNFSSITIEEEQTKRLMVIVDPAKEITPVYTSSNEEVATVSNDGTITGIKEGSATITVVVDGNELTCSVNVTAKPIEYKYEISENELVLDLGASHKLEIIVTPALVVVPTWSSSDDKVATVSTTGEVSAVGKGNATITATLNGNTYTCAVTVNSDIVLNGANIIDGAGVNVNLTDASSEYETLYWEHYQEQGTDVMLNALDLVLSNSIASSTRNFYDYLANIGWSNGYPNSAWDLTRGGKCTGEVVEIEILVNPNVKQIMILTGGWRATGVVELYANGVLIGKTDSFVAEESGIARIATFDITVEKEITVLVKIVPSNLGDSGNVSNTGVVILGEGTNDNTTVVEMNKTEMTGVDTWNIDLTGRGTIDWYYVNGSNPIHKENGNAIDPSNIKGGDFWDYKAGFTWSDGTANPDLDDTNGGNGKCGGSVRVDVTVDSNTKHVYLYVGGYQSTYYIEVVDSKGNILHNELLHEATNGSVAYEVDYKVVAAEEEKLTFIIYRNGGGNCSLAAVCVANNDIEYQYSLSTESLKMNISDIQKISVNVNPYKVFEVSYTSSNEQIATVSNDGTITALALGDVIIYANVGDEVLECVVNVVEIDYEYTINKESLSFVVGGTDNLVVTAEPVKEDLYVVWESSNNKVATVTEDGKVVAVGEGDAVITGSIGNKSVTCNVVVTSPITIGEVLTSDIANTHHDLTNNSSEYDTLYWEHYQEQGTDAAINAKDLILSNTIENSQRNFGDYKATLGWTNGTNITSWDRNSNGKHTYDGMPVVEVEILVNPNVKQIKFYVGAWNATGLVSLYLNGVMIAKSEEFVAGGDSVARVVVFNINVKEETKLTAKVDPIILTGGNVSNQAIVILGENEFNATTSLTMSKALMVGNHNEKVYTAVDLSKRGVLDWYYMSYDRIPDEMKDANYITSIKSEGSNYAWDYPAVFKWHNGTTYEASPMDNDTGEQGTNNIRYGGYHAVEVLVNENTKYAYFYVGGYESTYSVLVIDSNGTVIYQEEISNATSQYELKFEINAKEEEKLMFVIYKESGANCSLAAVAISNIENTYSLNVSELVMNVDGTYQLVVNSNPSLAVNATYESTDESVITVSETGLITALKVGNAKVKVLVGEIELLCLVEVEEAEITYEYNISDESLALDYGKTHQLEVSVNPDKTLEISWESEDTSVATVDNGLVTACGNGSTTIKAYVDGITLTCEVTVTTSVVASANVIDANGKVVDLTQMNDQLLYWEHYEERYFGNVATASLIGATDLIKSNSIEETTRAFGDYKVTFNWVNANNMTAFKNNTRGLCTDQVVTIEVLVNPSVTKIEVYTGAWRADGVATMYLNNKEIAKSDVFSAGESGIATIISFDVNVTSEATVVIKVTPTVNGESGNISNPAVLIYGSKEVVASKTVASLEVSEITGINNNSINLTEKGPIDWYYSQYDHTPDEMANGNAIHTISPGNSAWDYRGIFTWSNGTTFANNPNDNDVGGLSGSNNSKCSDFFMSAKVNVDESTNNIYFYVTGWDSAYGVALIDGAGNVLVNQQLCDHIGGATHAYECNFAINATGQDTLTLVVYKIAGSNCGFAAIAVA